MYYPRLEKKKSVRKTVSAFRGYEHRLKTSEGAFYDTENLSTRLYPMMSVRKARGIYKKLARPQGILEKDALAWVDEGALWYNGVKTPIEGLCEGEKQLVSMGAYICIFPDKCYYNTADPTDYGAMEARWSYSGRVSYTMCDADGVPLTRVAEGSVGDSGQYKLISAETTRRVSLAPGRYSVIRLSFSHPGTAIIYTADTKIGETQWLEGYLSENDTLDSVEGTMESYLAYDAAPFGGTRVDWRIECDVEAGREYTIITKSYSPDDAQFTTSVHIIPPETPTDGYILEYAPDEKNIAAERAYTDIYRRYTVISREIDFRYRGTATIAAGAAGEPETPQLRMYLCTQEGVDLETGIPTATPLAAAGNGAAQAKLSCTVTDGVTYYLYIVVEEVLCGEYAQLAMKISSPAAKFFKITETADYADLDAVCTHSASPGQGGVSRLRLSFQKSGMVRITAEDAAGQMRYLKGAISQGTDIDAVTGAPTGLILAAGSGNTEKKEYSLSFFAQEGETYYLFSRDVWVYGSASFVIRITPQSGQTRICVGGGLVSARAYIYSNGAWRAAQPLCRINGAWHTCA